MKERVKSVILSHLPVKRLKNVPQAYKKIFTETVMKSWSDTQKWATTSQAYSFLGKSQCS